jgi:hypothetical protein
MVAPPLRRAADAERDLALRERVASTGASVVSGGTKYNDLFRLTDASTNGRHLVLEREPSRGRLALWQMLAARDMAFALC